MHSRGVSWNVEPKKNKQKYPSNMSQNKKQSFLLEMFAFVVFASRCMDIYGICCCHIKDMISDAIKNFPISLCLSRYELLLSESTLGIPCVSSEPFKLP